MDYNKLSKKAHQNAVEHGFWMERNSNEHCLMLIVTEIGEMVEADRMGKHYDLKGYYKSLKDGNTSHAAFGLFLKDTTEDEMADVAIRLAASPGRWVLISQRCVRCAIIARLTSLHSRKMRLGWSRGCRARRLPLKSESNLVWNT